MPSTELQWLAIDDFTPGIYDLPGTNYPPGTAQRTNTYRCISFPGGCLGPGPRRVTTYPGTDFIPGDPSIGGKYYADIFTAGPIVPTAGAASNRLHNLWIGTEYITGGNRILKIERIRLDESPTPTRDVIKTVTSASAATSLKVWGVSWGITRTNRTTPLDPTVPVVVWAWGNVDDITTGAHASMLPDDTTPTSNTPYDVPGMAGIAALLTCHQGRLVFRCVTGYGHGANSTFTTTEDLRYTDVFDPSVLSDIFNVVPEIPNGYPAGVAMSANELFLLKETGGVVLSGDIADPTVTNLPMVPGVTDGQTGARTPLGFMYGNRYSGVWAWAHGDGAKHLSPQLLPDFWTLADFIAEPFLVNRYSWESSDNLVFLSNTWMLNTDTGGWWRLDDASTYPVRHFSRQRNWLYGSRDYYTAAATDLVYSWDLNLNANDFSWQSQPLWRTLDRLIEIREVGLRIKGAGTVAITLTAQDGTAKTITFTCTGSVPKLYRQNIALQGEGFTVKIVSTSTGSTVDAPIIYPIQIGYQEISHLATSGTVS